MNTQDWTVNDHLDWIRQHAAQARFMNEIKLNVMLTTMQHDLGLSNVHSLDVVTTTNKYRAMGVIK